MLRTLLSFFVVMLILCTFVYPFALNTVAKFIFPYQSSGSLVDKEGRPTLDISKAVGSKLLGQDFNKPYFLHSRVSVSNYNTSDTNESSVSSGGFNYAMSNPALKERVQKDLQKFLDENPQITKEQIPLDLLSASGSGLDPHISLQAALVQIPRISQSSKITKEELEKIIQENTESKFLGIFGEEKVNVLAVNIAIAKAMKKE
ncbi:potassium-transporting ATPase subunit KdpC [Campylobacter jejuni]|uniref:potassium-transporting ATPase subunit KdpC n=1 Tax=Campylobacter TaxID=194 RepID=UPI00087404DD|nr:MULTISPECIES: potassium-transporting ATPase subunit KdpC [Campylobacter]EAH6156004.1 potassium-transporting ATPase subunit KdpC [Campylobacter jejuni]EAH9619995.1 potassium-transporting ATPase subunit KdpC [Campylobacter jejuni]EAI4967246.1 potassium-transporting ATPase subunit KdpC [Campylobacter jejuni]EAI8344358.1 potassium-transporting ATPase subunit KdpC [Campylobacter jejuni]EAI9164921.1 potassium-transporting ATPase subunit KdpC [Campylobacter jejuni]